MTEYRILVVDDEPLARQNLAQAIAASPDWIVAACCEGAEEARKAVLAKGPFDLALIDICMPGESGVSLARYLASLEQGPLVAFVTAYDEYAIDAFELYAIDYLQKPFSDQRLARLLHRAQAFLEMRATADPRLFDTLSIDLSARAEGREPPPIDAFVVRSVGSIERILLDDVQCIRGAGNYVELKLAQRTVMHRASMGSIAARLPPGRFMQVHRTAIVQRRVIRSLNTVGGERYQLLLHNGMEVPVSATYLPAVRAALANDT